MSAALEVSVLSPALAGLQARIRDVAAGMGNTEPLLEALGAELVSQMQRRVADEKQAPDGRQWESWSDAYAQTRHGNQSLLQSEGSLLDSLQHQVSPQLAVAGSNLVYAAAKQFGFPERNLPARPYAGISAANEADLLAIAEEFASAHLRRAFG